MLSPGLLQIEISLKLFLIFVHIQYFCAQQDILDVLTKVI